MPKFNSDWIDRTTVYARLPDEADGTPHYVIMDRPVIVCLCGSTRFKDAFVEANYRETMAGKIVLSVGWFSHADGQVYTPTPSEKEALDELHKRKIDLADEILVLNVGGYIGDSTRSEIAHAARQGKTIRYLEPLEEDVSRHCSRSP